LETLLLLQLFISTREELIFLSDIFNSLRDNKSVVQPQDPVEFVVLSACDVITTSIYKILL